MTYQTRKITQISLAGIFWGFLMMLIPGPVLYWIFLGVGTVVTVLLSFFVCYCGAWWLVWQLVDD